MLFLTPKDYNRKEGACKATAKFKALKLQKVVEKEGYGNLKLYTGEVRRDWTAAIGTELVNEQSGYERYLASSLGLITQCRNIMCYNATVSKGPCHQQHEEVFKPPRFPTTYLSTSEYQ